MGNLLNRRIARFLIYTVCRKMGPAFPIKLDLKGIKLGDFDCRYISRILFSTIGQLGRKYNKYKGTT
jgi:hypothetical protein